MTRAGRYVLIIAVMTGLSAGSYAAEAVRLKHILSVYRDVKGTGLTRPEGIACDGKGRLVVADTGNGRLLSFTLEDGELKGGSEIKLPEMAYPIAVQVNSKGEILSLDGKSRRIFQISPQGEFQRHFEQAGVPPPGSVVPKSMKIDSRDNVYILDLFAGRLLVFDAGGKFSRQIPFPAKYGFFEDLAVDANGTVFLLDGSRAEVHYASKEAASFSLLTTRPLKEYVKFPVGIAVDERGDLFLIDKDGNGIVVLGPDGTFRTRQSSTGWKDGLLYYPTGICLTGKGELGVADRDNNRVQVFRITRP